MYKCRILDSSRQLALLLKLHFLSFVQIPVPDGLNSPSTLLLFSTFLWQPKVLLRPLLVMFSSKLQPDRLPLSESPSFPRFALIAAAGGCWRSSSDCSGGSLTSPTRKDKEIKQAGQAAWQNQHQHKHTTELTRIFCVAHVPAKAVKGANIQQIGGATVVIRMPHVCEDTHAELESRQEDIGEGGRKGKCSLE